jgi:mannose-6-phosphate isomerase-like protein (cupin superfamily)
VAGGGYRSQNSVNMPHEPAMEPDFFNVFTALYEPMTVSFFAGSGAEARILYRSSDGRHLAVASRYPDGVRFRYGGTVDYQEVFYIVRGRGSRTLPDQNPLAMSEGDLIYVRPGVEIDYVYEPGFADVAFFWSDSKPLSPTLTEGLTRHGLSD